MRVPVMVLVAMLAAPLALGVAPVDTDDCGTGGDAGGAQAEAARLVLPIDCSGHLLGADRDQYVFEMPEGHGMRARISTQTGLQAYVCIIQPGPEWPQYAGCGATGPEGGIVEIVGAAETTGDWRLRLDRARTPGGRYHVSIEAFPLPPQDDCGFGRDSNYAGAVERVALPLDCEGEMNAYDARDAYVFEVPPQGADRLDVVIEQEEPVGVRICVTSPGARWPYWCRGANDPLSLLGPSGGDWIVRVDNIANGGGPYRLRAWTNGAPGQDDCASGGDAPADGAPALLGTCDGRFVPSFGDNEDAYSIALSVGEVVETSFTGAADARLCLLAPNATSMACRGPGEPLAWWAEAAGTWRIQLKTTAAAPSEYTLTTARRIGVAAPQDDCGSLRDATDAAPVPMPASGCGGAFPPVSGDRVDLYDLAGTPGAMLSLAATSTDAVRACLETADGATVGCGDVTAPYEDDGMRVRVTRLAESAEYAVAIEPALAQDDCGSGRDAAGTFAHALPLAAPACQGALPGGTLDRADWYAFDASEGQTISLTSSHAGSSFACLVAPSGRVATCTTARVGGLNVALFEADEGGAWRLRVVGAGEYAFALGVA